MDLLKKAKKYIILVYITMDVVSIIFLFFNDFQVFFRFTSLLYCISSLIIPCFFIKKIDSNWDIKVNLYSLIIWLVALLILVFVDETPENFKLERLSIYFFLVISLLIFRIILMRAVRYAYRSGKF